MLLIKARSTETIDTAHLSNVLHHPTLHNCPYCKCIPLQMHPSSTFHPQLSRGSSLVRLYANPELGRRRSSDKNSLDGGRLPVNPSRDRIQGRTIGMHYVNAYPNVNRGSSIKQHRNEYTYSHTGVPTHQLMLSPDVSFGQGHETHHDPTHRNSIRFSYGNPIQAQNKKSRYHSLEQIFSTKKYKEAHFPNLHQFQHQSITESNIKIQNDLKMHKPNPNINSSTGRSDGNTDSVSNALSSKSAQKKRVHKPISFCKIINKESKKGQKRSSIQNSIKIDNSEAKAHNLQLQEVISNETVPHSGMAKHQSNVFLTKNQNQSKLNNIRYLYLSQSRSGINQKNGMTGISAYVPSYLSTSIVKNDNSYADNSPASNDNGNTQEETSLRIIPEIEFSPVVDIPLQRATSQVMVQSKDNRIEYQIEYQYYEVRNDEDTLSSGISL